MLVAQPRVGEDDVVETHRTVGGFVEYPVDPPDAMEVQLGCERRESREGDPVRLVYGFLLGSGTDGGIGS